MISFWISVVPPKPEPVGGRSADDRTDNPHKMILLTGKGASLASAN
jgi:hypothetical protein